MLIVFLFSNFNLKSFTKDSLFSTLPSEVLFDEEMDRFQRDLENLEVFNMNMQSSLQQFHLTNSKNSNFSHNRSIDITKNLLSPKSLSINPSIAFPQNLNKGSLSLGINEEIHVFSKNHPETKEFLISKHDLPEENLIVILKFCLFYISYRRCLKIKPS